MCNPVTVAHPEVLLAKGTRHGFEWEVTSGTGLGFRCGYVRIPAGHPWHGKDFMNISADVHGGLTFAEPDLPCGKDGPDDAWWFGFDAGHAWDAPDPAIAYRTGYDTGWWPAIDGSMIRTTAYMIAECEQLCGQAADATL